MCLRTAWPTQVEPTRQLLFLKMAGAVVLFELLSSSNIHNLSDIFIHTVDTDIEVLLAAISSDDQEKRKVPKIEGFVAITVPRYTDMDFKSHFRLTRPSVQVLLERLGPAHIINATGRPATPLEDKVLLGLWFLANLETFRQVSERFKTFRGNAHDLYKSFLNDVNTLAGDLIRWPTGGEAHRTIAGFNSIRGPGSFPNVLGCIDGMHIRISCPKADTRSYVNRKQFPSVLLQAVCDSELRFTNVFAGWPGASHDARVYRRSELGRRVVHDPASIIPDGAHLLGDGAYPLTEGMMCPYRNNGHLTDQQIRFNVKLSSTRIVIEQAFGHLIGRFRRLRCLEMKNVTQTGLVIKVACILHNLCINLRDHVPNDEIVPELHLEMNDDPGHGDLGGRNKRDMLANMF